MSDVSLSDRATPACPVCGSAQRVYRVSQVYVAGITRSADRSSADQAMLADVFGAADDLIPEERVRPFAPVAGKVRAARGFDWRALAFILGVAGVVFLLDPARGGSNAAGIALALVVAAGIAFLFLRRAGGRADPRPRAVDARPDSVEQLLARWKRLCYCAADRVVFDVEQTGYASLDDLPRFLRRTAAPGAGEEAAGPPSAH